ncbi:TetR/AcrR family transcriptional regulator [Scytonema sp. NUACC26]|uniref:TetR/AcrR family transcriptional regulator n=1 Tax=Scytonema sp. NUACC26 TaxID=3140176 RepID=UPI0034DC2502
MSQKVENNRTQIKSPAKSPSTRRRNQRSHQAILQAASELLEEKGYGSVCIEAIATRAGVGKQTIYRWWSSKAAVIMEACATQATSEISTPDTGLVQKDLYTILQQLFNLLKKTPTGNAIAGLIAEAQTDPEVAKVFYEQFVQSRRQATYTILERGIARGELRSDLNLELAIDAIYGPVWYRLLLKHAPLDDSFAKELVNLAMVGIQV